MILSEIGLNVNIKYTFNLKNRDLDKNHDWINDNKQNYNNSDLIKANIFLKQIFKNGQKNVRVEKTLNDKQKLIFKRIELYYYNMLVGI